MKSRTMNSDTAAEGERAASLLSSVMRMCGNKEKAERLAAAADVLGKRCIQASIAEERSAELLDCPNCPNQGWYMSEDGSYQEQCEFCYTVPMSVFNYESNAAHDGTRSTAPVSRGVGLDQLSHPVRNHSVPRSRRVYAVPVEMIGSQPRASIRKHNWQPVARPADCAVEQRHTDASLRVCAAVRVGV